MEILVTGGAGFIGAHVARLLGLMGHKVVIVDRLSDYYSIDYKLQRLDSQLANSTYEFLHFDCNDSALYDALGARKFDLVLHLAAQPGVRVKYPKSLNYVSDNIGGFTKILKWSLQNKVSKFVYASSSSVYESISDYSFSEESILEMPSHIYAQSKRINEIIANQFIGNGETSILGLRLFSVYGPWGRPDMACLRVIASCFLDYEFVRNGDGNIRRDFTFIDDAAQSICALLDLEKLPEGVINIGGGHDRSLNEMLDIAQNSFGNEMKLSQAAASNFDLAKTKANSSRLQSLIGEIPSTTLEEGMSKTINWAVNPEINSKLLSWIDSV